MSYVLKNYAERKNIRRLLLSKASNISKYVIFISQSESSI